MAFASKEAMLRLSLRPYRTRFNAPTVFGYAPSHALRANKRRFSGVFSSYLLKKDTLVCKWVQIEFVVYSVCGKGLKFRTGN